MTPEQRYLFDLQGFLHLESALSDAELSAAQNALSCLESIPDEELPPGIERVNDGGGYTNGFSFDPAFEHLAMHPSIWPMLKELTANRPRLASGSLRVNTHLDNKFLNMHSAREEWDDVETPRYFVKSGRIYCDFVVAFFYLSDVHPGDGGLLLIPGSHRSEFDKPVSFYEPGPDGSDPPPNPAVPNLPAKAGDVVIMTELTTHGALKWKPTDRTRSFLMMRYVPQFVGSTDENLPFPIPEEVTSRLSPKTQELIAFQPRNVIKNIVKENGSDH